MKKIAIAAAAALGLATALSTPASAQVNVNGVYIPYGPAGSVTCVAQSPSATGFWHAYDGQFACSRAVYECQLRTPSYQYCNVTRWWYN